jgi:4a-hydroxytetrahydrobiopterin dehydratase
MAVLSNDEIGERLRALSGWSRKDSAIVRQFAFAGFPEAVEFVSRLVPGAEAADHHPDLTINYRKVTVSYSTHSEGGVTEKDFAGAERADQAARETGEQR